MQCCCCPPPPHLCEGEVNAAAVTLVAEEVRVRVDAQEADQAVQLSNTVLGGKGGGSVCVGGGRACTSLAQQQQQNSDEGCSLDQHRQHLHLMCAPPC